MKEEEKTPDLARVEFKANPTDGQICIAQNYAQNGHWTGCRLSQKGGLSPPTGGQLDLNPHTMSLPVTD